MRASLFCTSTVRTTKRLSDCDLKTSQIDAALMMTRITKPRASRIGWVTTQTRHFPMETLGPPIKLTAVLTAPPLKITTDRYYSAPDLLQQTVVVTAPTNGRLGPSPDRCYQLMRYLMKRVR